jgi:hypothetical protein
MLFLFVPDVFGDAARHSAYCKLQGEMERLEGSNVSFLAWLMAPN